jgi:hypothetical protein
MKKEFMLNTVKPKREEFVYRIVHFCDKGKIKNCIPLF